MQHPTKAYSIASCGKFRFSDEFLCLKAEQYENQDFWYVLLTKNNERSFFFCSLEQMINKNILSLLHLLVAHQLFLFCFFH